MANNFTNKILDLSQKLKYKSKNNKSGKAAANGDVEVVDITFKRQEIIADERRRVKRTILTEFIGACIVIPNQGLCKVTISNISDKGMGFDMDRDYGHLQIGDEVALRIYLNNKTYFPFTVRVNHVNEVEGEAAFRHGVSFVKGEFNDVALHHFVKFIESVSSSLETDNGDIMVTKLKV
ncbi:MAG: hypothetical protein A4S09_15710 [Proteobacteria bacterium SG_bin7]|nr:MAG: hypothetical protein A4S09_15710 [Proteobacteria bacterium SG_bin7]